MSSSTYELKYLKYKNKYLNLKKILNDQSGNGTGGDKCFDTWVFEQYQKGPANAKCGGLLSSCKELKILGNLHLCMYTTHPVIKQMISIYPTFLKITDFNWNIRKHFLKELINDEFSFESIFKMGFYLKEVYDVIDRQKHDINKVFKAYTLSKGTREKEKDDAIANIFQHNDNLKEQKSKDAPKPFTVKELLGLDLGEEIMFLLKEKLIVLNKNEVTIDDFLARSYCERNCDYRKFMEIGYTLDDCLASKMTIRGYSGFKDLKQLLKKFTMKEILTLDWNKNYIAESFTIRELLEGLQNVDKNTSINLLQKIIYDPFYGKKMINVAGPDVTGLDVTDGFKKVFEEIKSLKPAEERLNIYIDLFSKFKTQHDTIFAAKVLEIDNKMFLNKIDNKTLINILKTPIFKKYFYNDTTKEIFINKLTPIEIINANILSFGEAVKNLVDTKKIELGDVIDNWKGDQITYKVLKDAGFDKEKLLMANLKPTWIARMGF